MFPHIFAGLLFLLLLFHNNSSSCGCDFLTVNAVEQFFLHFLNILSIHVIF